MKLAVGILGLASALALQATAYADEPEDAVGVKMPRETSADGGEPEWYRQFSFSSDQGTEILLSPGPASNWGLSWTQGDRWAFNIDRTSRQGVQGVTAYPKEEMSAGAMFRLTPRISVGGEVSVGADSLDAERLAGTDEEVEAGIRFRSAFKF